MSFFEKMKSEKKKKIINLEGDMNNNFNNIDEDNLRIEVEKFILGAEEAIKNCENGPESESILKEKQKARDILFREIIADKNYENLLGFILKKVIFKIFYILFFFFRLKILQIMKSNK